MSWGPDSISRFLADNQHRMDGPAQWIGTEPNTYAKDWDSAAVRVLMAAAWPYEQAAGNQSIPAVWKTVNDHQRYLCDRYYLPSTARDMRLFERAGVPVFGLEHRRPLADYDVVGTSISYVVLLMNLVKYLRMSDVPLRWADRVPEDYPMVMVGGQAFCNPEVLAPVADCVFVGEAEDEPGNGGLGQVLKMIEMFKAEGSWNADRVECYQRLARTFNYLYFPRFVDVLYADDPYRHVSGYRAAVDGMRVPFRKRHVLNLDSIAALDAPPLLFTDPSMGSGDQETSRGCPAWCTFCRLTYAQKPFRQHSVDYSVDAARRFRNNVGGVEISPFGPDFPMQTNKNALLKALLENVSDKVDTVAQRIDDFISDDTYLLLQSAGGARSITLGLEGVDQRMRDLVGKATSDAEVIEAITRGIRAGFRKFKLFMIVGLPGEDTGDVAKVMELARNIAAVRDSMAAEKVLIQFSFTPLLYEAQTPFQWFPCWPVPDHDLIDVANELRELKILFKIGTKAEPNKVHFFQLCQRASRDAGEAVIDVLDWQDTGCWGGVPKDMTQRLALALQDRGFANGFGDLFGERERGDMLGWEFISTGISRDLLWNTFAKMRDFAKHTDSATYDTGFDERYHGNEWIDRCDERCLGNSCGVCSGPDLSLRRDYLQVAKRDRAVDVSALRPVDQTTIAVRVRARLRRPEKYRWADNEFRRHLIRRAGYRAQDRHGGPCVSKNSIWFASDAHAFRDWSFGIDYAEFGITQRIRRLNGAEAGWVRELTDQLVPWLDIDDWQVFPANVSMRSSTGASLQQLELMESPDTVRSWIHRWQEADHVPMRLKSEGSYFSAGVEEVNAKDFVDDLWAVQDDTSVYLRMLARRRAGPYQVWQALSGKASWIEAAARPARTLEVFAKQDNAEGILSCERCGWAIPESVMGDPWAERCPRCGDEEAGIVLAGLEQVMT
jgi:radical SAM superfamily enzyme YgiQ (UPF0313 family)